MRHSPGSALVEVMIAIAVFVIGISTIATMVMYSGTTQRRGVERQKALLIAEEGLEAVRSIRDRGWSSMATGTRGLVVSSTSGMWEFSSTSDVSDGYTRSLEIAASGTTAYRVTSTVSWAFSGAVSGTVQLATVMSDWQTSLAAPSTGCGPTNWASSILRATVNLPGTDNALAVIATGTLVFVGQTSGSDELTIVDTTSSTAPTVLSALNLTVGDVQALALSTTGSRVYIGGTGTEITIVDYSSTTAPTVVGSLDIAGSNNVNGLAVSGTLLYVTREFVAADPEFVVVNVINPAAPVTIGSANGSGGYWGVALSAVTSSRYAYSGSFENGAEFRVVNIAVNAAPTIAASLNLGGSENARDTATSGTIAYLSSLSRLTGGVGEFHTIDVALPLTPSALGQIEYGADVSRIHVNDGVVFAGSASGTREFSVINATNPFSPAIISGLNLTTTANDVWGGSCRAYVVTSGNSNELYVISSGT